MQAEKPQTPAPSRHYEAASKIVLPAMFLYVLFGQILASRTDNLLIGVVAAAVTYFISVYLYYGVAALSYRNKNRLLWLSGLVLAVIGLVANNFESAWSFLITWVMILLAGSVTGYMAHEGYRPLKIYLTGLAIILLFTLVLYLPYWPGMMKMMADTTVKMVADFRKTLLAGGFERSLVEDSAFNMQKMLDILTRLIPASMIMGVIVQYSIGFLMFFARITELDTDRDKPVPFYFWKMPFGFIPVVIVAILLRLTGGDTLKLAADNILLILAVYYCLTGLALGEYFINRFKISMTVRILYYILLILSNLYGFLMMALLGFIDSFKDWRKAPAGNMS